LRGYDLFRKDRPVARSGGGVLLYVKCSLNAVQSPPVSTFPEQVWCCFHDVNKAKYYVGVCYRTPSIDIFGSLNHNLICDMLNELQTTRKHFILKGDFNYRFLSWPPLHNDQSATNEALGLFHCLEDCFFTQHVECCTRVDSVLDLVITDEPDMVSDLLDLGTFATSDHNALLWKVEIRTVNDISDRQYFDYSKADTVSMKRELQCVDWDNEIGH